MYYFNGIITSIHTENNRLNNKAKYPFVSRKTKDKYLLGIFLIKKLK